MGLRNALAPTWTETLGDYRVRRFWTLGLIAMFLHGVADPAITYLIVDVYDVGTEANPWLAAHLSAGAAQFALIHIPLYVVALSVFVTFTWLFHRGSDAERARIHSIAVVLWTLIILWGVVIVGNNLLVLADGTSLV